jgi:hypothetical protein
MKTSTASEKLKDKVGMPAFKTLNLWLAGLNALQGAVILLLSATKSLPVQTSYLTVDPVSSELAGESVITTASRHLFDVNMAYFVAGFFLLVALLHLAAATIARVQYEDDLKKKINRLRWLGFGLTSGTMLVALAMLGGVVELSALIMILALSVVGGLSLMAAEIYNQAKAKTNCLSAYIGVAAVAVPWVVLGISVWGANLYGSGDMPAYLYGVYASAFVVTAAFIVNAYKQYKKQGKWSDFLYGERIFLALSLVLTTAVAWQIFAGALRP